MRIGQKLSIPLGIIVAGNAFNGIVRGEDLFYYLMYVLIFVPIAVILLLMPERKNYKIVSLVLLVLSCIGVWFKEGSTLVSAVLFCDALYIAKPTKRVMYLYTGSILLSIILNLTVNGINVSQFIVTMAGAAFIVILYQHYIHPKPMKLDDEKIRILQKLYDGCTYGAIADEIMATYDTVYSQVRILKKRFDVKTKQELINKAIDLGFIKPNMFKNINT
jgi:DNA-binding CsgD family transcriptional regulator